MIQGKHLIGGCRTAEWPNASRANTEEGAVHWPGHFIGTLFPTDQDSLLLPPCPFAKRVEMTSHPKLYIKLRHYEGLSHLRNKLAKWESLGVAGVTVSDHLFTSRSAAPANSEQSRHDPFVLLTAIGALSDTLGLSLLVANVSHLHPFFVARQANEVAYLFGGHRTCVGIGAGWNAEEFHSLGRAMPSHSERVRRLEESAKVIRNLFHSQRANQMGEFVVANNLPLGPIASIPPRLAVGGGSVDVIRVGAKYADHFDYDAPSHRLPLSGTRQGELARTKDVQRRFLTTIDDLIDRKCRLEQAIVAAGRSPSDVTTSINVSSVVVGDKCGSHEIARELNYRYKLQLPHEAGSSANILRSPFVIAGSAAEAAEKTSSLIEILGLDSITLPDTADTSALLNQMSNV